MPYCERHLAVGIEIRTNRRLAGWPICDECFNGVPITVAEIRARMEAGTMRYISQHPVGTPVAGNLDCWWVQKRDRDTPPG